ncbi:hypothetical protein L1080_032440 [Rhodococcus sp. MSC1_016]|uniref:hypothetical protein n=1 Tax=Rhodococcus sp. MSC1_016 TaxID=2909266 RepID=UPI00202E3101|nr:hypothetical protein [Rhodococcus sp. MSC1_016]
MWATALSIVAIAATVANFLFTQWRTDQRETDKWRRDEMLRLTGSMLELSGQRQSELSADLSHLEGTGRAAPKDSDPWALTRQMAIVAQQLHLLDEYLARKADAVRELHSAAEHKYSPNEDPYSDTGQLLAERPALETAHDQLVEQFHKSIRPRRMRRRRNNA